MAGERIRWELHLYPTDDDRDVEILSGHSHPVTDAHVEATLAVLVGQWSELRDDLEQAARAALVKALTAPSAPAEEALSPMSILRRRGERTT